LAVALLAVHTNAVEVKSLIQKNSNALINAQNTRNNNNREYSGKSQVARAQTSANLELSANLFGKLRAQFASKATSEEEAFNAIASALLSVDDVQACVEAELASQWGITSTLQCFAPAEAPVEVSYGEPIIEVDPSSPYVELPSFIEVVDSPVIAAAPEEPLEAYLDPVVIADVLEYVTSTSTETVVEAASCTDDSTETVVVEHEVEHVELDEGVVAVETSVVEQEVNAAGEVEAVVETSTTEILVDDEVAQVTEVVIATTIEDGAVVEVERTVTETVVEDDEVVEETVTTIVEVVEEGFVVETTETVTTTEVEVTEEGETVTTETVTETVTDETTGFLVEVTEHYATTVEVDGEVVEESHNIVEQYYDEEGEVETVVNTIVESTTEDDTTNVVTETTTQVIEEGEVAEIDIHVVEIELVDEEPVSITQEFVVETVEEGQVVAVDTHSVEETLEDGEVVEVSHEYTNAEIEDGVVVAVETFNVVDVVEEGGVVESVVYDLPEEDVVAEGDTLGDVVATVAEITQELQVIQCERQAEGTSNVVEDVIYGGFDGVLIEEPSVVDEVIAEYLEGTVAEVFPEYAEEEPVLVESSHCSE